MAPRTLLVIGSGPGIGVHTAIEFARQGFTDIHMLSRNSERLQQEKQQVLDGAGRNDIRVFTHSVDITKAESLKPVLSSIQKFGPIECVFFNAARVGQSQFFDFPVQEIEQDLNVGAHHIRKPQRLTPLNRLAYLLSTPPRASLSQLYYRRHPKTRQASRPFSSRTRCYTSSHMLLTSHSAWPRLLNAHWCSAWRRRTSSRAFILDWSACRVLSVRIIQS